jgi:PAS domain
MAFNYKDDPILGPAFVYWLRKCGTSSLPRKRDIDPTEIHPKILPNLQIIEVIGDGTFSVSAGRHRARRSKRQRLYRAIPRRIAIKGSRALRFEHLSNCVQSEKPTVFD